MLMQAHTQNQVPRSRVAQPAPPPAQLPLTHTRPSFKRLSPARIRPSPLHHQKSPVESSSRSFKLFNMSLHCMWFPPSPSPLNKHSYHQHTINTTIPQITVNNDVTPPQSPNLNPSIPSIPPSPTILTRPPPRSPPRQALGNRPRHGLQPRRLPRHPRPRLRRHLPPRPSRKLQGGVRQVQGGRLRRRRMGNLHRRLRAADVRCWCAHQCHGHAELQGSRVSGIVDFLC